MRCALLFSSLLSLFSYNDIKRHEWTVYGIGEEDGLGDDEEVKGVVNEKRKKTV